MEQTNVLLKHTMVKSNIHYINLKENIVNELDALKTNNDNEIEFFTRNHKALQVSIFKFRTLKKSFKLNNFLANGCVFASFRK